MRKGGKTFGEGDATDKHPTGKQALDYDAGKFWNSFFKSSADSGLNDRATIGPMLTETASRFHFNAVEYGIIRAIAHHEEDNVHHEHARIEPAHWGDALTVHAVMRRIQGRLRSRAFVIIVPITSKVAII